MCLWALAMYTPGRLREVGRWDGSRDVLCAIVLAVALGGFGGTALVGRAAVPAPLLPIVHASSDAPAIDV